MVGGWYSSMEQPRRTKASGSKRTGNASKAEDTATPKKSKKQETSAKKDTSSDTPAGAISWTFYRKGSWHTYTPELMKDLEKAVAEKNPKMILEDHDGGAEGTKKKASQLRIRRHLDDSDSVTTSNTQFYLIPKNAWVGVCPGKGCCEDL